MPILNALITILITLFIPLSGQAALEKIRAAVPEDFPPHYSINEGGTPEGFAIDVIESLAAKSDSTLLDIMMPEIKCPRLLIIALVFESQI